jgi:hypothetical protein
MSPINRVPGGIPAGGQFAPTTHAEPGISLGSTFSPEMLRQLTNLREDEGAPVIDLTEYQLAAVRSHIDQTGNFSSTEIRKAAEDAYFLENRYTPDEYQEFVTRHGDTSNYFGDPDALRRDIEQMRKDKAASIPSLVERRRS